MLCQTWSLFNKLRNASHIKRCLSENTKELNEIKEWLRGFSAGSVTCKPISEGIVCVEWEHKRRLNAFTGSMAAELDDIFCQLEPNCPKGIILRGANGNFSSGSDLSFVEKIANRDDGVKMSKFMQYLTTKISEFPSVSVALLEGVALGGGAELALCADFRVAVPNCSIGFKQSKLGLTTAWGGGGRLVSLVGRQAAMRLLLSGDDINPEEALRLNIVDHLIPGERLPNGAGRVVVESPADETFKWLYRLIGKLPVEVVHAIKQLIQQSASRLSHGSLEAELGQLRLVWGKQAHIAALSSLRNSCNATKMCENGDSSH